ncbi:DUF1697 domain-containing protein [Dyadobacter sp. Leaf189]|uniref:DUF1697 domain-containing protein n=1 Tax=Dyadobacter sp. Leaf189 TaxID=1736295 RepID=UPI0006FAE2CF|nr:DUF1697 domain-containing protein [Dyadobacter sp. Leaf189]KQS30771.1 hypothetical protein ASG33_10330 [Dyadobacter sp. Leaf189]
MPSQIYIAMLRGINVSGKNMIKMSALAQLFTELGLGNVKTYIQSGNVLFSGKSTSEQELAAEISAGIKRVFDFQVETLVVSLPTLNAVLQGNPFINERNEDVAKLHATFLYQLPDAGQLAKIDPGKFLPDEFMLVGETIYVFCPEGYGRTKLTNNFFENKLKVTATTRNWKTVTELVRLAQEMEAES